MELKDKVVIVTGAGDGIGEGIATVCAREGAAVVVMDRNEDGARRVAKAIVEEGGKAMAFRADVTRAGEIEAMVAETVRLFGTVDVLVNNAGINVNPSPFLHEMPQEQWSRMLGVNLTGVFLCSKAVLPLMIERRRGKIVNIASIAGMRQALFGGIDYTTSKFGVIGLTQHLAWEVAPHGINVNAVCPGAVLTSIANDEAKATMRKLGARLIPLGNRPCTTHEIAQGVVFLAGERSNMVTGHAMPVDGGMLLGYGEDIRQIMLERKQRQ